MRHLSLGLTCLDEGESLYLSPSWWFLLVGGLEYLIYFLHRLGIMGPADQYFVEFQRDKGVETTNQSLQSLSVCESIYCKSL